MLPETQLYLKPSPHDVYKFNRDKTSCKHVRKFVQAHTCRNINSFVSISRFSTQHDGLKNSVVPSYPSFVDTCKIIQTYKC